MEERRGGWKRYRWSGLIGLACALLVGLLPLTGWLERWELRTHDLRFHLRGLRPTQARIVIAGVEDSTLQTWPEPMVLWGGHYADVIRQTRAEGAAWIGMDVIPAVDADEYAPHLRPTAQLARALQAAQGRVVLSNLRSSYGEPVNPAPGLTALAETAENIGFVDLPAEEDDTVRTAALYVRDREGVLPGFIALLAARVRGVPAQSAQALCSMAGDCGSDEEVPTFWIDYTGRAFTTVPAERLATGQLTEAERSMLRGAVILIGATHRLSNDKHLIAGGGHEYRSGVEVQAQALATLLDGAALRRWTRAQETLLTLAITLLLFVPTFLLPFGRSLLLVVGAGLLWCAAVMIAFTSAHLLLPLIGPLLGLALPWPVFQSVRSLEERLQRLEVEGVFGRYVSAEIRNYILSDPEHQRLGGEECEATILFVDLRGSTSYAEGKRPSEVLGELNTFFGEIVPAIDRQQGLLYGYRGDGLMAVFGAPKPLQNHAQAAVDAAMEIVQALRRFNADRIARGLEEWRIGCGLNSGPVVCGNLGAQERSEFTVVGDTVNLAARLEALNKELGSEIVLSEATYQLLTDPPPVCGPIEQEIRGHQKVQVFRVIGD